METFLNYDNTRKKMESQTAQLVDAQARLGSVVILSVAKDLHLPLAVSASFVVQENVATIPRTGLDAPTNPLNPTRTNLFQDPSVRPSEGTHKDFAMINNKTLRNLAVCGVSLPTFAVSPAVAKATIYMPSQVAARVFGGRATMHTQPVVEMPAQAPASETSHAA